jgi:hypothetical protein
MAFLVAARSNVGEWLSLVEHLVRDQGVGGSNPLSPTNCFQSLAVPPVDPLVLAQVPYLWKSENIVFLATYGFINRRKFVYT